ncbi:glycosyltransferase family 2 protein [uncultured Winogradskyella sp.]|uniref:glycosyltransferase family 2 protein n=1 Tax=uncultured Winogradskyella sp. TaxID=395353 RepID=UPI002627E4C8|nr:glycosyltransferase family 2 protein [uncultured Winogradskyella sp.]
MQSPEPNKSYKDNVFTVIVSYNGLQWLKDCLDSVYSATTVVVVDNCSSDDTVNFIAKNYKDVILLPQQENLGFGKGNNLGISYALNHGAAHVLLLNQDAKMAKGSIPQLLDFLSNHTDYGIVSPVHCDWSGAYLEASFSNYMSYDSNKSFYSDAVLGKTLRAVYNVPFIAAACWFIPRKTFEVVGGFDPIFFHLGEDVNYAQRVRYHGYKIGVLPKAYVCHDTKYRVYEPVERYSKDYFYKFNYRNKIKYADVNLSNWEVKLKYNKRQVLKTVLVALITLKFKAVFGALKEYRTYDELYTSSQLSRLKNQEKGSHYLTSEMDV